MLKPLLSYIHRAVFAVSILLGAGSLSMAIAQTADSASQVEALTQVVEKLRVAMLEGDETVLNSLVEDQLTYGHSQGMVQNKAEFVKYLVGPKAPGKFNEIKLSEQSIQVVGEVAVVRHTFDAENVRPDGSTSKAHIHILQIWQQEGGKWKLLARQACPLKS